MPRDEVRVARVAIVGYLASLCLLFCTTSGVYAESGQRRRAVLVGINAYRFATPKELDRARPLLEEQHMLDRGQDPPARTWNELYGAVRDVHRVASALSRLGFTDLEKSTLTDEAATRAAILGEIKTVFIDEARNGDALVFYFSGHGSQMVNSCSATKTDDHLDETIVPWDANVGYFDIRDKELARLFNEAMSAHRVTITAIFDSCHSGTMVRALGSRNLHAKDDKPDPRDSRDPYGAKPEEAPPESHGALILTAARKDQSAMEAYDDDASDPQQMDGAYTLTLLRTLDQVPSNISAEDFERALEHNFHSFSQRAAEQTDGVGVKYDQVPAMVGTPARLKQNLFGLTPAPN